MTPSASIGMGNSNTETSGASSNLYSSISSNGMPEQQNLEQSQQPIMQNPAEQFLINFRQVFESTIKPLLEDPNYSFASKEADLVKRSLENYMEAVVVGLSTQVPQGGELI